MKLADLRQSPFDTPQSVQCKHELIVCRCECYRKENDRKLSNGYEMKPARA